MKKVLLMIFISLFLVSLASASTRYVESAYYNYDYQYSYEPYAPVHSDYHITQVPLREDTRTYNFDSSMSNYNQHNVYDRNVRAQATQNIPVVYYGFDRGFTSNTKVLNQDNPSNIHLSDSAKYFYKYTSYFGGYYEAYKCYNQPPKDKLFYIKCPNA